MSKVKVGLMVVASHFESGGERAEDLASRAEKMIKKEGYEPILARKTIWDPADALIESEWLQKQDLDFIVVLHASWVLDSLQYLIVNIVLCPLLMWAVPFTETFSLGCVQHFGSILSQQGMPYGFIFGLPEDKVLKTKLETFALGAKAYNAVTKARIALLGPRQTWRVANSQDMTSEEWEFTGTFGSTIVHIEMSELIELMKELKDKEAKELLVQMRKKGLGKEAVEESRMLHSAKVYLGLKKLFLRYGLTALAAECYPDYAGLANVAASWFADEGIIVDTEGDISHTAMMIALNSVSKDATALGEVGNIETTSDSLLLAHEGSTAHSLAADISKVKISPLGTNGAFVGLPLKPMPKATAINICGKAGEYTLTVLKGSVLETSEKEWAEGGSKLVAKFKPSSCSAMEAYENMLMVGADHHLLIKEGDLVAALETFCALFGIGLEVI